jgi:predicted PurR-regulated permease PerM
VGRGKFVGHFGLFSPARAVYALIVSTELEPDSLGETGRPSFPERLSLAVAQRPHLRTLAEVGLFLIALLVALYVARDVIVPLTFALMLYFLLRSSVRLLMRLRLPRAAAGAVVLLGVVLLLGAAVFELSTPAANWAERLPVAVRQLEFKSRAFKAPVEKASRIAEKVEQFTEIGRNGAIPQVAIVKPGLFDALLESTFALLGQLLITLIAAYFLLLDGDTLLGRLFRMLPDFGGRERATAVINQVELRMGQYLRTVTLINLALGVCLGAILQVLGMPNPWLWAGMASVLNYVPYLGPAVGMMVVALASFVSFDQASSAILPPLCYLALTSVEGNILTPLVLGRAFRISPLVVFVWLAFWAWLWSVPGAILAVPMLMLINIICEQSPTLSHISRLIRG